MKKICVVTGNRAEYGLLRWVLEGIQQSSVLQLQLIVTGAHLSPEFGLTLQVIEADGFQINKKIEMLLSSDTPVGVAKSVGLGIIGFADALSELKPDLMIVLGDRFEIFAAAAAASIAKVPIAHMHGGERTEGAFDEAIRHSLTKMSHLHFVAAEEYRKRVIQLGENPARVFKVGGLGLDNISKLKLLNRDELEKTLNFKLQKHNLLVTYHPVTLEDDTCAQQIDELLSALAELKETGLIFTAPNADTGGREIFRKLENFCETFQNAKVFTSLGQINYLSCIKHFDCVIGNSSSGIIEAPSFKKGTINIGDRQRGRLKAQSIIDTPPEKTLILSALNKLFSDDFQKSLITVKNPYGTPGASAAIISILEKESFDNILKKVFFDLPMNH